MKVDILGVKVDKVNLHEAVEQVTQWLASQGQALRGRYIVTPNIEIIVAAQQDQLFNKVLNASDLAIPDSSRFGWAIDQIKEKNLVFKLLKWPLFLIPQLFNFDIVTGTDLMEELIKLSSEKGFTIGFLGGRGDVALKLKERLLKKYPKLKVTFVNGAGEIDYDGQSLVSARQSNSPPDKSGPARSASRSSMLEPFGTSRLAQTETGLRSDFTPYLNIPNTDLLFVAFGHVKQEKWIYNAVKEPRLSGAYKNLKKYPVKVMMGVGGAFDYLSGEIPRAPVWIRKLGFEWLFRAIFQPWRIKRFVSLVRFIFLVLK